MTDPLACGHERPTADPGSDCLICASVWASTGAPTVLAKDQSWAYGANQPEWSYGRSRDAVCGACGADLGEHSVAGLCPPHGDEQARFEPTSEPDAYCAHGDESPEVGSGSVAVDTANAHLRACEIENCLACRNGIMHGPADASGNPTFPGVTPAQVGALLDGGTPDPRTEAKAAKPQPQLTPFGFVMAMGDVFAEGLTDGRKPHGWQALDSAQVAHDYRGALLRHYAKGEWAAVAVNACILWWHERKAKQ